MSQASEAWAAGRLALLARAAVEGHRYAADECRNLDELRDQTVGRLAKKERPAVLEEVERLVPEAGPRQARSEGLRLGEAETGGTAELLRQRAGLELKLQTEQQQREELEQTHKREQTEHREAVEALSLQRRKLKELQEERSRLLSEVGSLESKLRVEINATEQAELKYQKLKASRQIMGDQATEQAEQINALKAENERMKQELEAALQERDTDVASAKGAVEAAEDARAETAFKRLWERMRGEVPEVFVETNVPTEKTFAQLCDAFVEFLRTLAVLELHVHHLLRDLRQVSEKSDKLNHFYIMFTKNPGLAETLRDYLTTGKRKGNFMNLLRAQQAWVRAFASGTYKVIVRSPGTIADELNYRKWPLDREKDAAVGKYLKETAQKAIPDKLGTLFRKQAADMAYEDYNDLMKRK
jgi:DNA repair exonuclease SbcCD ATPase subunit